MQEDINLPVLFHPALLCIPKPSCTNFGIAPFFRFQRMFIPFPWERNGGRGLWDDELGSGSHYGNSLNLSKNYLVKIRALKRISEMKEEVMLPSSSCTILLLSLLFAQVSQAALKISVAFRLERNKKIPIFPGRVHSQMTEFNRRRNGLSLETLDNKFSTF